MRLSSHHNSRDSGAESIDSRVAVGERYGGGVVSFDGLVNQLIFVGRFRRVP